MVRTPPPALMRLDSRGTSCFGIQINERQSIGVFVMLHLRFTNVSGQVEIQDYTYRRGSEVYTS